MNASTELQQRLGLKHPIIQAPMAGVATPELAAAVSRAGGLGSLGLATSGVDQARAMIRSARQQGARPLNVNFFCHRPSRARPDVEADLIGRMTPLFRQMGAEPPIGLRDPFGTFHGNDALVQMLLEERPEVISFHFGLPAPGVLEELRQSGAVLIASATSLEEGLAIQAAGLDAVVAQGIEAGGHRGIFDPDGPDAQLSCLALTQLLVARLNLPVIAAGGIMNGGAVAAALSAGAALAQLGTAFIACPESQADDEYRAALVGAPGMNTCLTPAISGRPARGVNNALIGWIRDQGTVELPDYPRVYDATLALIAAAKSAGVPGYGAQWAGQGAPLSRAMPAEELMAALVSELEDAATGKRSG